MLPAELATSPDTLPDLERRFRSLRQAFEAAPYPDAALRRDRLLRAIDGLVKHERRIVEAAHADFGQRAEATTLVGDVLVPVRALRHALRNLDRWMKPERRRPDFPLSLLGARAYVFHQPLGVIGIMAPWNSTICLAYTPLAGALAAGNRAFLKPSEFTPALGSVLAEMVASSFAPDEVDVVQGGVDVASAFAALPFDHLVFTGSARTARDVLRAAANHLTPVTLELGGKAPVIVARGFDLEAAAEKLVGLKLTNGGQICMGPDHVLVHESEVEAFVVAAERAFARLFPDFAKNPDVTYVPLPHRRRRLAELAREAAGRGARVIVADGSPVASLESNARFPLVLVVDPPADAAVMREEIFGPVLPVVAYGSMESAVARVRESLSRPLAVYMLGGSESDRRFVLRQTHSGGASFGEVMLHPLLQDLPFGGVGESGMGRYMGRDGFRAMSNPKAVAHKPWIDVTRFLQPPYPPSFARMVRWAMQF